LVNNSEHCEKMNTLKNFGIIIKNNHGKIWYTMDEKTIIMRGRLCLLNKQDLIDDDCLELKNNINTKIEVAEITSKK
jgi:hypothetical protein